MSGSYSKSEKKISLSLTLSLLILTVEKFTGVEKLLGLGRLMAHKALTVEVLQFVCSCCKSARTVSRRAVSWLYCSLRDSDVSLMLLKTLLVASTTRKLTSL